MHAIFRIVAVTVFLALPGVASADPICTDEADTMDKHRYLRTVSLDLRGTIPTVEEHALLESMDDVPVAWIDEWLESDAFADRAVRLHHELLWLPIIDDETTNRRGSLSRSGEIYWRPDRARQLRGNEDRVPCADEPAVYGDDGEPVLFQGEDENWREGWEMVVPYWDPTTEVKVCAFDARSREYADNGAYCGSNSGQGNRNCGCGPDLQWCTAPGGENAIEGWLVEDVERRLRDIVLTDRPYTDLFTGTTGYVNGPLVHYWTHMAPGTGNISMSPAPIPEATLPDLHWTDIDTWVEIELGPQHAGVLTSVPFLLRFNSNRARANRFFERFLCRPFVPPIGGIPTTGDEIVTLDLQRREGCEYCHAMLEPAAAHWGRWPVGGASYLNPEDFPPVSEDCLSCATTGANCTSECRSYYLTETLATEQEPFLGKLAAYEFRDEAHEAGIEEGPILLVNESVVDGTLPACSSRTAAEWLLGEVAYDADAAWYDGLGETFVGNDFSWRQLVKAVVTSDVYRSVR